MVKPRQLLTFFRQSLTRNYIVNTIIFALLFLVLASIVINLVNILNTLTIDYSLSTKLKLLAIFIFGAYKVVSPRDLFFLTLIAVLFGANFELILQKIRFLKSQANLELTIGSGLISIAVAGCASCGLSVVSFIGLGSVLAILPFGGIELYFGSIIVLLASFVYNLNALYKACKIG